jgi:hypothetical protein
LAKTITQEGCLPGAMCSTNLQQISLIINDFYPCSTDRLAVMFGNCDERHLQVALFKQQLATTCFMKSSS